MRCKFDIYVGIRSPFPKAPVVMPVRTGTDAGQTKCRRPTPVTCSSYAISGKDRNPGHRSPRSSLLSGFRDKINSVFQIFNKLQIAALPVNPSIRDGNLGDSGLLSPPTSSFTPIISSIDSFSYTFLQPYGVPGLELVPAVALMNVRGMPRPGVWFR